MPFLERESEKAEEKCGSSNLSRRSSAFHFHTQAGRFPSLFRDRRMWSRNRKKPIAVGAGAQGSVGGGDNSNNHSRLNGDDVALAAEVEEVDDKAAAALQTSDHPDLNSPSSRKRLLRKLYLHTVPIACLITCATFIDRANLALAAPVLLHDIGLSRSQFGFASAVMFVSYGLCMWASALMFTVVSLKIWFCAIVTAWGFVTALMATIGIAGMKASTSFGVLVVLRLALGAAEAGTMPGCFFLLSRFLPKRELAYAYSWVLVFTVMAQVIGAPLGAAFIGPAEGFLGMRGWQVMFIVEGALTAILGLAIPFMVSDSVEEAPWLSEEEKAWVAAAQKDGEEGGKKAAAAAAAGAAAATEATKGDVAFPSSPPPPPPQKQPLLAAAAEALQVAKSPQMWVLGIAILLVQTAFFAVTFFAPLLIADTFSKEAMASSAAAAAANAKGDELVTTPAAPAAPAYLGPKAAADAAMNAALKSTSVYAPSALTLVLAGALCRATGDRKLQASALLAASAVGFALVPVAVAGSSSRGALLGLVVGSCGGVGALAALATWPDRYVTGRHRCAEYAFWNSFVAIGGFGGPYLMGATSLRMSMSIMAAFQLAAGLILLVFGFVEDRGDRRINEREKEKGDGDGEEDCPNRGECSGAGGIV